MWRITEWQPGELQEKKEKHPRLNMRSEFPSRAGTEQGLMASHPKVQRTESREREDTGQGEFGSPSVVVKTQERVPTTVSNSNGGQMTQLLQIGKVHESTDSTEFGGLSSSLLCNWLGCIQRHSRPFQCACLVFLSQHVLVS